LAAAAGLAVALIPGRVVAADDWTYIYMPTARDRAEIQGCIDRLRVEDAPSYCRFKRLKQLTAEMMEFIQHYFANDTTYLYGPPSVEIGNMVLSAITYCHMNNMVAGKKYPAHTIDTANECMHSEGTKIGYAIMRGLGGD
jgi:hypothetical protein